jgi:tRNA G18 (ribose-2'-O)-methylase SpoU
MLRKLPYHEIPRPSLAELAALPRHPLIVVVEDVRSAYNVGAILRTSDALLLERVVCCGFTPSPDHRRVAKTALGAQDSVPWTASADVSEVLDGLGERGYTRVALEIAEGSEPVEAFEPDDFPLALVVGNEVEGVSDRAMARCDRALELPQYGAKHSLNVSVAFGIAAYGLVGRFRSG